MFDWLMRRGAPADRKSAPAPPSAFVAWQPPGRAHWSARDYATFARDGYGRNAVAHRCVRLIAESAAAAPFRVDPFGHPLGRLLARPNPEQTGGELMEGFFGHLQVAGNAFLHASAWDDGPPGELFALRPDRVAVIPGPRGWPVGWEYRSGGQVERFERCAVTERAPILHLKTFHPLDARPFPHFPARADVWADGAAWRRGHWLNGRAGAATLAEVVAELCARAGVDADASALSGVVGGYVVDAPTTLGAALAPLMDAWRFMVRDSAGVLAFAHVDDATHVELADADIVDDALAFRRADPEAAPMEVRMRYIDGERDYRIGSASARQRDFSGEDVIFIDAPLLLDAAQAGALCEAALADARAACVTAVIDVAPTRLDLEPGDLVDRGGPMRIARIEDAATRRLFLVGAATGAAPVAGAEMGAVAAPPVSRPHLVVLDLPPLPGAESDERPLAAVRVAPWRGAVQIHAGAARDGVTLRGEAGASAGVGELVWALHPGPLGRWDDGNVTRVHMPGAALASVDERTLLAGANAFAVRQPDGEWEIVQARTATLVDVDTWELRDLLRGQQGAETTQVAAVGATVVLLDERPGRFALGLHERTAGVTVVAPPAGYPASDVRAAEVEAAFADVWARPFAPAHVRAVRDGGGDVHLSWIRRTRLGGDAWQGEVPLAEETESFRVEIRDGAAVVRVFTVAAPHATYAAADQFADFGALPATLSVTVAQVSARHGPGRGRDSILQL